MTVLIGIPVAFRAALLVAAAVLALASTGTGTAYFSDTTTNGTNRLTMEAAAASSLYWAGSGAAAQSQSVNPNRWSLAQEALGLTWSKVATGLRHTCGVTTGGKLYCWGGNSFGQLGLGTITDHSTPTQVGTATDWTDVQAGRFHTCALAGTALSCWGSNSKGQIGKGTTTDYDTPQSVAGNWSAISLGMSHTCGINTDKRLYCWGWNSQGQLGISSTADASTPAQVGSATTWTAISAGSRHTCGLQGASSPFTGRCWGMGMMYALGNGATPQLTAPSTNGPSAFGGNGVTWKALSAGRDHTCGVLSTGAMRCVGAGYYGQTGTGTLADLTGLATVGADTTWTAVQTGSMSTCGLQGTALSCWGGGHSGELARGSAEFEPSPAGVLGGGTWSSISLRYDHLCAISNTGALHCAGSDGYGQLGRGAAGGPSSTTLTTIGSENYTMVATSGSTTCGVGTDTKLWCWGSNGSGQFGNGNTTSSATPVQAGSATGWQSVSVGGAHVCAINSSSELWCWGRNNKGQLGLGDTNPRTAPTKVGSLTWKSVSAGTMHTCAITTTNALYCFGANTWGQLGDNSTTDRTSPTLSTTVATWNQVHASSNFTCGLSAAMTAYCWGEGVYGQYGNPSGAPLKIPTASGNNNANVDISVGVAGACADNTNGTNSGWLYCWGAGQWGQLASTDPAFKNTMGGSPIGTGWKKPMLGGESVCAAKMDSGIVYCWGDNSYGQLALGDTDDRAVTTAAVAGTATATSLTMGTRTMLMINHTSSGGGGGDYEAEVAASSPTYYWRLNEPSGTTAAPTVGAISGTYAGSPGLGAPGATLTDGDAAVTLDGVNDYVTFGDHNDFDFSAKAAMSVEVWVKRTGSLPTGVWPRIVSKDRWGGASDRGGWSLLMEPSDTGFTPGSVTFTRLQGASAHEAHATTAMVADTWYHVVATYDGTNMKLYVNGQLESTVASALSLENNAIPLTAGGMTVSDYLQGGVDEVALYSRALGAVEIADHYAAAF